MAKQLTAEQRAAAANVDPGMILTDVEGKPQSPFAEPQLVAFREYAEAGGEWRWTFYANGTAEVNSSRSFGSSAEAKQHATRIMGMAWNIPVLIMENQP